MKVCNINSYYYSSGIYKELLKNYKDAQVDTYAFLQKKSEVVLQSDIKNEFTHTKIDRLLFFPKHIKTACRFEEFIKDKKYDLFHAHSLFSNGYIAYLARKKHNIPYIVAVRDTDVNTFYKKTPWLRPIAYKILEKAEKIIFISAPYKEIARDTIFRGNEKLYKKSIIVPNGINDIFLNNSPANRTIYNNKIKLLFAGALSKRKNLETVIKSCEILLELGYDVTLTVVGKVVDKYYEEMIKRDFINYLGSVAQEKLIEVYAENDVLVVPSKTETFGLVYAEAMSQGLPVIYTKGQGFDGNFAEGEVGHSIKFNDYRGIADKILEIYQNYDAISCNCIQSSKQFDWQLIANRYEEIYKDVL